MASSNKKRNTHFIVTNREIIGEPNRKKRYLKVNDDEYIRTDGRELASENLRFGEYSFKDKDDDGKLKIFEEPDLEKQEEMIKAGDEEKNDDAKLPSNEFFKDLYGEMKKKEPCYGEVLIFIHGYNCELSRSLDIIRKLHYRYVENEDCPIDTIVMFTWPAMGKIFKYRNDARDAKASGYALGRAFHKLSDFLKVYVKKNCMQRIHLMAHSMGAQVLEAMMLQLSDKYEERLNNLLSEVVLVGADVARHALESPNPLYDLTDICERVHVFYHRRDRALGLSETTKNAFNRLGKWGAKNSNNLANDVYQYDISHTKDDLGSGFDDHVNHWSYYTSEETIEMITDVFTDFQEDF